MTNKEGDKLANYLAMIGHACADINQGAITAMLPFFMALYGFSYTEVTTLVLAANICSAFIQPLFGIIGDKKACPWFMAIGVFLAGSGICLMGVFTNFWAIAVSAMVSGIGVAMFHPEGGRIANLAAGERKSNGMSIFAVGGNIGFFVGPIMMAACLSAFGMHGTIVFIVPCAICSIVLLGFNKRFKALGIAKSAVATDEGVREHWGKFSLVMVMLSVRSIVSYGLVSFIPLFLVGVLGQTEVFSSMVISILAISGAISTVLSGRTSEKVGTFRLIIACWVFIAVFIFLFTDNRVLEIALALALLATFFSNLFYPSAVALGMSYVPRHLGTASGISYGIAVSVGGIASPFLGMVGDSSGLPTVMFILGVLCLVGAALSVAMRIVGGRDYLPASKKRA